MTDLDQRQSQNSLHPARKPIQIAAEDARGGEIILRTRRRRIIFLAGLIGMVALAVIVRLAGLA